MNYKNLFTYNDFFFLGDNYDKIFKEELFGIALYEKEEGIEYNHIGVCGSFNDAYKWLNGKDIKIIKIHTLESETTCH